MGGTPITAKRVLEAACRTWNEAGIRSMKILEKMKPLPSFSFSVPKARVFEFSKIFVKGGYRDA
jgi:hypothetical protein